MTIITIAQVNPTVNKVKENTQKIQTIIDKHSESNIIILPEMVTTGYPLEDLVFDKELQKQSEESLTSIKTLNQKVVLGALTASDKNKPYNSAVLLADNQIQEVAHKNSLPTYGVFDEYRLFSSQEKPLLRFEHNDKEFTVIICEEMWDKQGYAYKELKENSTDVVIVINGSPFEIGKTEKRTKAMKEIVDSSNAQLGIYVNLIGGQDDIVFDGNSFIYKKNVGIIETLLPFEEDIQTFNIDKLLNVGSAKKVSIVRELEADMYNASVLGLKDYIQKNNMGSVVIGVSGGIDSALVATIAADAIGGKNVYGISMPSQYSSVSSLSDAETLMENINGNYRIISLKDMFDAFKNNMILENIAEENLQARIRGTILMGVSNQEHRLVLAPGNKSELAVGYSTIYGDAVGGYAPLKDVYKTDVYKMAVWRNKQKDSPIPVNSIIKAPSAELSPGQVDQDNLPEYELLDSLLKDHLENKWNNKQLSEKYGDKLTTDILKKINRAEWKRRQYPIGPKMTSLSFGRERFAPITR